MPIISVIVPVYKVEKYLEECIDSILFQTFADYELILIDDGSPDRCGEICDWYAKKDKRIKVIHQENKGLSAARNAGLDIAESDYITFIDSDDIVSIHYLEDLYQSLCLYNADITVCNIEDFSTEIEFERNGLLKNKFCLMSNKDAVFSLYSENVDRIFSSAWGKLYKKELFEKIRFPISKIFEDQFVIPIIFYNSKKVIWIDKKLYGYRQREGSIIRSGFSLKHYDDIEAMENCITYFESVFEFEIVESAKLKKKSLLAYYSLLSRKAGIYQNLPKKYQMSRVYAIYTMKRFLPYNVYSYRLAKIYPQYISIEAHIRRLLQMIGLIK